MHLAPNENALMLALMIQIIIAAGLQLGGRQKAARRRRAYIARKGGRIPYRGSKGNQLALGAAADLGVSKNQAQQVVKLCKYGAPTVISQTQFDSFGTFQFQLADTECSSVAAYWQQYMITKVVITFRPMYRSNSIAQRASALLPLIFVAVDPNDISSWTVMTQAEAHDNVIVNSDEKSFKISFKPSAAVAMYAGAFTSFGHADGNIWIDTGNTSVRHYGVKWGIQGSGVAGAVDQAWNVTVQEFVSLRYGR